MNALALLVAAVLTAPAGAAADVEPPADLDPAVARLVAELRERLAATPESAAAHAELALAYEANGLWRAARDAWAAAVGLDPDDPDRRLHLAISERQSGDFAASLATLEGLAAAFPEYAPGLQRLGLARLDAGDAHAARATFSALVRLRPGRPEGYAGLGDARLRLGEIEPAIRELEAAVELDPSYAGAHYLLGQAYRAAGRRDQAGRHLARGRGAPERFLPDSLSRRLAGYAVNLTARLERASASLADRRPEQAIAILQRVRADHPRNVTVLNNLAIAHLHAGDLSAARELLDQALEADERKFSTYLNLAAWSQRSDRPEEALRWSDEAVARAPGVAATHLTRASALVRLGRLDEAIDSFRAALAADFRNQEPYLALANLELRRGNAEPAASYSRRAIDVWPDLVPAHLLLFHASLELGDLDRARAALSTVRLLAPDHPRLAELQDRLARAERGE